ncbi:hypothetical protein MKW98_024546 [Papaver atlanticum]|uniref:FLZ-type domain-containing protein n=1 Tax=Papaver atlanticum TaxID=357466 RepID=A0AAD4X411_9MAGN|nr:hypothetical protein MKW98_024546 [Papaver atlanticum]
MLRRAKSTLVLQESTSLFIKKDSSISSQESNNIIAVKPTFKLSGGSLKTSSKMSNGIFTSVSESNFMKACGLCRKKLSPLKNIYMYKGDQSFCSDDCRCRKILIEELLMEEMEEETTTELVPRKEISSSSTHFATNINVGNGLPPRRNHVRAAA